MSLCRRVSDLDDDDNDYNYCEKRTNAKLQWLQSKFIVCILSALQTICTDHASDATFQYELNKVKSKDPNTLMSELNCLLTTKSPNQSTKCYCQDYLTENRSNSLSILVDSVLTELNIQEMPIDNNFWLFLGFVQETYNSYCNSHTLSHCSDSSDNLYTTYIMQQIIYNVWAHLLARDL